MSAIVMRRPCLMEDEGRHSFVNHFATTKEAEKWIAEQAGQYFQPTDYYIAEPVEPTPTTRNLYDAWAYIANRLPSNDEGDACTRYLKVLRDSAVRGVASESERVALRKALRDSVGSILSDYAMQKILDRALRYVAEEKL